MTKPKVRHNASSTILKLSILAILALAAPHALGDELREMYVRTGGVTGQFQGKDISNGVYTTDINLQIEAWFYNSTDEAFTARVLMSNESGLGRSRYFGVEVGQRYYLFNDGVMTDMKSGKDFVSIKPNLSYYVGWDAGMAQFLVVPYSDILASYTSLMVLGGTVGVKKSLSPNMSIDVTASYTFGYSINSSLSLTTNMLRFLAGLGYSF